MNRIDSQWIIYRVGNLCQLHLLNKHYKPGDEIIGIIDFGSRDQEGQLEKNVVCVQFSCVLHRQGSNDALEGAVVRKEFTLGLKKGDFSVMIPSGIATASPDEHGQVIKCLLCFLFHITTNDYPEALFEDRAGITQLCPKEVDTKQFSCDFPISIYA